jgi:hypothetical protein
MNTYVAIIGGKVVLAFRAEDDDEARAMIDPRLRQAVAGKPFSKTGRRSQQSFFTAIVTP